MEGQNIQIKNSIIIVAAGFMFLCSCNKCNDTPVISYFAFEEMSPLKKGIIDQSSHTITVEVPESTDVKSLIPTINAGSSDCLKLSPLSGTSQDFSTSLVYEVSNEIGDMVQYEVTVLLEEPASEDSILSIHWSSGSDMPEAVAWSSYVILDNKCYVIGGANAQEVTNVVQVYDPVSDTWNDDVSALQKKRWGHSSTVVDGKIFVMGGTDVARGEALTSIEVYDPATGNWEFEGEMSLGRIGHRAVAYQDKIYVFGGITQEPSPGTLDDVEVYDPAKQTWEQLTPMPTPRQFPAICNIGDIVYILGGGVSYPYSGSNAIEAYNITEDTWEEKANLKTGVLDFNACEIDGKIICVGGSVLWATDALAFVQVYDPATDIVSMANELPSPIASSAVFAYQGKIYVGGGYPTAQPEFTFSPKLEIGVPDF
jgi:hypothetical protein